MDRLLIPWLAIILVCFSINTTTASAQAEEIVLEYTTAFTLRDSAPFDGQADDIDDDPEGQRIWGLITNNSSIQYDEFLLEFDINTLVQACSVNFNFSFSRSGPTPLPYELKIAVYEADGIASLDDFGAGDFFTSTIISNIEENVFSADFTSIFNSFIDSGIAYLGIRLYEPISSIPGEEGGVAQLEFLEGNLTIIPTTGLEDTMHPTGAVHAYYRLHWPSNEIHHPLRQKEVPVTLEGYVFDELSIARDGEGIGVSQAYLEINNRKIILKDESEDLLDENGQFKLTLRLDAEKVGVYQVKLYAADTTPEEPNFGLVDSTKIMVQQSMSSTDKFGSNHKSKSTWLKKRRPVLH
jgi:hypothetical protein